MIQIINYSNYDRLQLQPNWQFDLKIMQLLKQLNSFEQDEFNRIRAIQNGLDEKTIDQALKYYIQYKNNTSSHISHDKLPIAFKSALFMAEKSTSCSTVNGERISQPSLTLGHMLKTHPLDEVMITLKDFTKHVNIIDKEAFTEMNNLIKEISFLITFHKKFEKSIQKFELKERHPQSGEYVKYWGYFSWLLFIQVRSRLLGKSLDLIENTCMLAHTLAFMLSFSWEHIVPAGILKQQKKITEQSQLKEVFSPIRDRVLEMFSIKTMDIYTSLATTFENFFENDLIKKGIIKTHQSLDFLSPELLQVNYRRLDKFYEKSMSGVDLDERVFLRERTANLTPSKFTPFARQGYANKGRKSGQNDTTLRENCSHRVLNYEMSEKQDNTIKIGGGQGVAIGRLPKAIVVSPSMMKVPLILATPISAGMEMLNYVNQRAKKFQQTLSQGYINKKPHQGAAIKHIDLIFDKTKKDFDKKGRQAKEQMVYSFFKLALEEYLSQHPCEKDNESCYKALMAISIELVLFANNSSLMFQDVQREINIEPFELWKACDFFLKFDRAMPSSLKLHLLDIEVGLLSYKLWKDFDFIQLVNNFANGQQISDPSMNQFFERWFKRLLHQTAFQIHQIGDRLKLQQHILQAIYDIMKHIISQSTDLLLNKNLDQLIMCSIFAINRKERLQIKFAEIIEAYKDANYYNREMHETLVKQINIEDKEPLNVISYYNQYFIKRLKEYVMNIKASDYNQENKKNYVNNPILMSPLKDILPKDMSKRNSKVNNKTDGNCHKELLVAYTDSPLLKHQPLAFKSKDLRVATGMINFQENTEMIKANIEKQKQYEKHSPRNVTNNYTMEPVKKPTINNLVSGQSNILWKQPETGNNMGGLTPNRSKNVTPQPMVPLSQFSSNSSQNSNIPPQARMSSNNPITSKLSHGQYGITNLGKGLRKYQ